MAEIPFVPITDPVLYNEIGSDVAHLMRAQLHHLHTQCSHKFQTTDAGALLSGALAGIMQFIGDTGGDWDEVQAAMLKQAEVLWPQIKAECDAQYEAAVAAMPTDGTA